VGVLRACQLTEEMTGSENPFRPIRGVRSDRYRSLLAVSDNAVGKCTCQDLSAETPALYDFSLPRQTSVHVNALMRCYTSVKDVKPDAWQRFDQV